MSARTAQAPGLPGPDERDQALHTLSYALGVDQAWAAARSLLLALAPKMEQAGHRDDWIPYLERGIEQSRHHDDREAEGELCWQLGMLLQLRGLYEEASEQYGASARAFEQVGSPHNQARALSRLAYVARLQHRSEEAGRLIDGALALLAPEDPERAYALFVQGCLAYDVQDWTTAARYYRQALATWRQVGDQRMIAWNLTNLGTALRRLGDDAGAIGCYQEAILLFESVGDPLHQAAAQMNLGNVYLTGDNPGQALEHYRLAEPAFRRMQDTLRLAMVYLNMGMACRRLGMLEDSERALRASVEQYRHLGGARRIANVLDELGLTLCAQHRLQEAVVQFDDARAVLMQPDGNPSDAQLYQDITAHRQEAQTHLP